MGDTMDEQTMQALRLRQVQELTQQRDAAIDRARQAQAATDAGSGQLADGP